LLAKLQTEMTRTVTLTTVVVVALAGVASAGSSAAHPQIYFLAASGRTLVPVEPHLTLTPNQALNRLTATTQLLRKRGLKSPFPTGSKPTHLSVAGGTATVALAGSQLSTLDTIPRLRLIGSVAYTLTSYNTIHAVQFVLNGKPWGVYDHSGRVIRAYQRSTPSRPWLPACAPADGCFSP
jgi:spore germination protein GerM